MGCGSSASAPKGDVSKPVAMGLIIPDSMKSVIAPDSGNIPSPKFVMPGEQLLRVAMNQVASQKTRKGSFMIAQARAIAKQETAALQRPVEVESMPMANEETGERAREQIRINPALQRIQARYDR